MLTTQLQSQLLFFKNLSKSVLRMLKRNILKVSGKKQLSGNEFHIRIRLNVFPLLK